MPNILDTGLPPGTRSNHVNGIAPYSGVVAVSANSRAVTEVEMENDDSYASIMRKCEEVGELLGMTAPIRVDIRRFGDGEFALFDVNLKPNMTGPGHPGCEDQASLMALAAEAMGWDYRALLEYMLGPAMTLKELQTCFDGQDKAVEKMVNECPVLLISATSFTHQGRDQHSKYMLK